MVAFISFPLQFTNTSILFEIAEYYNVRLDIDELAEEICETVTDPLSKELIKHAISYLSDEIYDEHFYYNSETGICTCATDNLYDDQRMLRFEKIFERFEIPYDSGQSDGLAEMHYRPGLQNPSTIVRTHPNVKGLIIEIEKILTILDATITDDVAVLKATLMKNLEISCTPSLEDYANNRELMLKHSGLNRLRLIS